MIMGTKTYDSATDLITFTRASGGTALRKISYGNELVTNGDFSSGTTGWVDGTTYSGALDASSGKLLITSDSSNGYGCAIQGVPLVVGKAYRLTGSRRAVSGGNPAIGLSLPSGGVQVGLLSGSASTVTNYFSVTFVASSTHSLCLFNQSPTNGNSSEFDNISVKEVLFGQSDGTLQLYNYPNNVPRIEYDAAGAVKGLLMEEARTNLMTSSGNVAGTGWAAGGNTAGSVTTGSPFGTYQTLTVSISDSVNSAQRFQIGKSIISGQTYVSSCLLKHSVGTFWAVVDVYDTGGSKRAWFDLQNGVVGTKDASVLQSGMIDYGDGWWLCWASATVASNSGGFNVELTKGDGIRGRTLGDTMLIAGTQFELGSTASSYIPTTTATVTRAMDLAEIPTSAFGYNNGAGTVVCEFDSAALYGSTIFTLDGAGSTNGITAIVYPSHRVSYQAVIGGVIQANLNFDAYATASQVSKVATVYAKDDFAAVLNGGAVATDTSGSVPLVGLLRLGVYFGGALFFMSGHIKSIQYYPRRLTNTQLQELTT